MRKSILLIAAASAAALALPAAAQVVGGVTGNVGGQVGVTRPSAAPVTGQVGQTVRDGAAMTRDTMQSTTGAVRNTQPMAGAQTSTSASGHAHAGPNGAQAGLNVSTGAMVHGSDGAMLGTVQSVTRDTAGRVEGFVVRNRDGVMRNVPATGARIEGDVLIAGWTQTQFNQAPAMRPMR